MNITINIQATELASAIQALAIALQSTKIPTVGEQETAAATDAPKEEKPKRERKQQEKPAQETTPEPIEEEQQKEMAEEQTTTDPETIPSVVELRAVAQEKGKTQDGKTKIKALLNKFESKSISDVPEEYRASFLALLEAI